MNSQSRNHTSAPSRIKSALTVAAACLLLAACGHGNRNPDAAKIRIPPGAVTNDHIVIARYGTVEDVPGQAGAIRIKPPAPGLRIKLDESEMSGPMAMMYYFDAVLLKENFTNGSHALYIHSPAIQNMTIDAQFGWLSPDEIIEKLGACFASNGVVLVRLSVNTFLATRTNELSADR